MPRHEQDYIFGYGSLLNRWSDPRAELSACGVEGYRRAWNVAMDNTQTIPGYKYYVDPESGERPALFVTFLNIRECPDSVVSGAKFPVNRQLLALLDRRERNYKRVDVTDRLTNKVRGRVFAYVGTRDGQERYQRGVDLGTAVVSERYFEGVRSSFERLGAAALAEFERTTDPVEVPLRPLRRMDVPAAPDERTSSGRALRPAGKRVLAWSRGDLRVFDSRRS
jgi:cation transport regulator ChaC